MAEEKDTIKTDETPSTVVSPDEEKEELIMDYTDSPPEDHIDLDNLPSFDSLKSVEQYGYDSKEVITMPDGLMYHKEGGDPESEPNLIGYFLPREFDWSTYKYKDETPMGKRSYIPKPDKMGLDPTDRSKSPTYFHPDDSKKILQYNLDIQAGHAKPGNEYTKEMLKKWNDNFFGTEKQQGYFEQQFRKKIQKFSNILPHTMQPGFDPTQILKEYEGVPIEEIPIELRDWIKTQRYERSPAIKIGDDPLRQDKPFIDFFPKAGEAQKLKLDLYRSTTYLGHAYGWAEKTGKKVPSWLSFPGSRYPSSESIERSEQRGKAFAGDIPPYKGPFKVGKEDMGWIGTTWMGDWIGNQNWEDVEHHTKFGTFGKWTAEQAPFNVIFSGLSLTKAGLVSAYSFKNPVAQKIWIKSAGTKGWRGGVVPSKLWAKSQLYSLKKFENSVSFMANDVKFSAMFSGGATFANIAFGWGEMGQIYWGLGTIAGGPFLYSTLAEGTLVDPKRAGRSVMMALPLLLARILIHEPRRGIKYGAGKIGLIEPTITKGGALQKLEYPKRFKPWIDKYNKGEIRTETIPFKLKGVQQQLSKKDIPKLEKIFKSLDNAENKLFSSANLSWEGKILMNFFSWKGWLIKTNPNIPAKFSDQFVSQNPKSTRFFELRNGVGGFKEPEIKEINRMVDILRELPKKELVPLLKHAANMVQKIESMNAKYGVDIQPLLEQLFPLTIFKELRKGLKQSRDYGFRTKMVAKKDLLDDTIEDIDMLIEKNDMEFAKAVEKIRDKIVSLGNPEKVGAFDKLTGGWRKLFRASENAVEDGHRKTLRSADQAIAGAMDLPKEGAVLSAGKISQKTPDGGDAGIKESTSTYIDLEHYEIPKVKEHLQGRYMVNELYPEGSGAIRYNFDFEFAKKVEFMENHHPKRILRAVNAATEKANKPYRKLTNSKLELPVGTLFHKPAKYRVGAETQEITLNPFDQILTNLSHRQTPVRVELYGITQKLKHRDLTSVIQGYTQKVLRSSELGLNKADNLEGLITKVKQIGNLTDESRTLLENLTKQIDTVKAGGDVVEISAKTQKFADDFINDIYPKLTVNRLVGENLDISVKTPTTLSELEIIANKIKVPVNDIKEIRTYVAKQTSILSKDYLKTGRMEAQTLRQDILPQLNQLLDIDNYKGIKNKIKNIEDLNLLKEGSKNWKTHVLHTQHPAVRKILKEHGLKPDQVFDIFVRPSKYNLSGPEAWEIFNYLFPQGTAIRGARYYGAFDMIERQIAFNMHQDTKVLTTKEVEKFTSGVENNIMDPYMYKKFDELRINEKAGTGVEHNGFLNSLDTLTTDYTKRASRLDDIVRTKNAAKKEMQEGRKFIKNTFDSKKKIAEKYKSTYKWAGQFSENPTKTIGKLMEGGNPRGGTFANLDNFIGELDEMVKLKHISLDDVEKIKKHVQTESIHKIFDLLQTEAVNFNRLNSVDPTTGLRLSQATIDAASLWSASTIYRNYFKKLGLADSHLDDMEQLGLLGMNISDEAASKFSGMMRNQPKDMTYPALLSRIYHVQREIIGIKWVVSEGLIRAYLSSSKHLIASIINNQNTAKVFLQIALGKSPYRPQWNHVLKGSAFYILSRLHGSEYAHEYLEDLENDGEIIRKPDEPNKGALIKGAYIIPEDRPKFSNLQIPFTYDWFGPLDDQMKKLEFKNKQQIKEIKFDKESETDIKLSPEDIYKENESPQPSLPETEFEQSIRG